MILWIAIGLCLLISFLFSGIEAGILSVSRVRLRHRVNLGERSALRLNALLNQPERLLLTVVIVVNLMNIFAITLTTGVFVRWWGSAGYILSFISFLPLYLFGLELLPKSLFRRFPYRALALLSRPLQMADKLLSPFLWLGTTVIQRVAPRRESDSRKLVAAREDFKYLTLERERAGALSSAERQLIHNVVDFRTFTARDLMQPLAGFPTVGAEAEIEELVAASRGGVVDRFLVQAGPGEIAGMVYLFEVLLDRGPRTGIGPFVRRVVSVPPTESAPRILRKLRAARSMVALVMDQKTPVGVVSRDTVYKRLLQNPSA